MRLRQIVKPILDRLMPPIWRWYVRKPRRSRWGDVSVSVPPGVFHPGLFLSTRFLLQHLEQYPLAGKAFLELGAGSGVIAIFAARRKAHVTATDISEKAIQAITGNAQANTVTLNVVQSDLFASLPPFVFDYIMINPPYYPKDPRNDAEYAWFCGTHFEYFHRLFRDLPHYYSENSHVLMVLSEDCKMDEISAIANQYGWRMEIIAQRTRWGEKNYIFKIFMQLASSS